MTYIFQHIISFLLYLPSDSSRWLLLRYCFLINYITPWCSTPGGVNGRSNVMISAASTDQIIPNSSRSQIHILRVILRCFRYVSRSPKLSLWFLRNRNSQDCNSSIITALLIEIYVSAADSRNRFWNHYQSTFLSL